MSENAPEFALLSEKLRTLDYVLGIDWSTMATYNVLKYFFTRILRSYKLLVFQVFSKSKELIKSSDDEKFYHQSEALAMKEAAVTFALSHVDRKELKSLVQNNDDKMTMQSKSKNINVLIPPLRDDFLKIVKLETTQ